jgi:hypothetical protein
LTKTVPLPSATANFGFPGQCRGCGRIGDVTHNRIRLQIDDHEMRRMRDVECRAVLSTVK